MPVTGRSGKPASPPCPESKKGEQTASIRRYALDGPDKRVATPPHPNRPQMREKSLEMIEAG
jgi:hypothetical protein